MEGRFRDLPPNVLLRLKPDEVFGELSPEDITALIKATNSIWLYPGEYRPEMPHAMLTSGLCSDGFVNVRELVSRPNLCDLVARELKRQLCEYYDGPVDCVIGSDTASLNLAYAVGRLFPDARVYPMHKVTTEAEGVKTETQVYTGPQLPAGSKVLRVEELVTTAKTFRLVTAGFAEANPGVEFIPFLPTIVDRRSSPSDAEIDGVGVLALVRYEINNWKPIACPLCGVGSQAIRPNTPGGWAALTKPKA